MKSIFKLFSFVLILIFTISISCNEGTPKIIDSNRHHQDDTIQLKIQPNVVFIGYKVLITGYNFEELGYFDVIFPDSIVCQPEIIKEDTLLIYVPFGAKSGNIRISQKDFKGATDILTVINDNDGSVLVKAWYLNYSISEKDSWTTNVDGYPFSWSAEIKNDTICLMQDGSGPNQDWHKTLCFKNDSTKELPGFISGEYLFLGNVYYKNSIETATINIQDWDVNGILSGKLFFQRSTHYSYSDIFWVDVNK